MGNWLETSEGIVVQKPRVNMMRHLFTWLYKRGRAANASPAMWVHEATRSHKWVLQKKVSQGSIPLSASPSLFLSISKAVPLRPVFAGLPDMLVLIRTGLKRTLSTRGCGRRFSPDPLGLRSRSSRHYSGHTSRDQKECSQNISGLAHCGQLSF